MRIRRKGAGEGVAGGGRRQAGGRRAQLGLALLLLAGIGAGCARAVAPEGGPVPELPPRVVSTSPESMAVVAPFGGPIRIEFERTLSERLTQGSLRDAVVVSPRTGEVTVSQRGNRVEVAMEGGFREAAVYRVTLLPRFQDRYRNTLDRPVEIFFSTGPDFDPTLVAGLLLDRLTGEEVAGARVDAIPEGEGPTYSAVSDSLGIFAFRYLPAGRYEIVAYEDMNRNRAPDFPERQAATSLAVAPADTLVVSELALLLPDTTAARLTAAAPADSVAVVLDFDDHLEPEWDPSGVEVRLLPAPGAEGAEPSPDTDSAAPPPPPASDTLALPRVVEVVHWHVWEAREAEAAAARQEAAADTAGMADPDPVTDDPTVPPQDPAAPPPAGAEPPEAGEEADAPILPDTRLVAILDGPLPPGTRIRVQVEGVVNLNGLPGGGGEATFEVPEAPEDPGEEPGQELGQELGKELDQEPGQEPGQDPARNPAPDSGIAPAGEGWRAPGTGGGLVPER